eukprot:scaffold198600_cov46-Cyclotella_meneghiniana.AAC.1
MSSTLFWVNVLRRRGSGIIIMVMIIAVCSSTTITTAMMKIGRLSYGSVERCERLIFCGLLVM